MALKLGIQTYQLWTNDDEVCIPSLSSILIAVQWNRYSNVSSIIMSKSDDLRLFYKMIVFEPWNFFGGPFLHNFCGGWAVFDLDTSLPEN